MNKTLKIHWLYDPTDESATLNGKIAKIIETIKKQQPVEIQPVYFFDNQISEWGADLSSEFENSFVRELKKDIHEQLEQFPELDVLPPHVLSAEASSQRGLATEAARYLKEAKSDLAVLATHARTGITRLVMGSFAESLLLRSETPLLMVSPYTEKDFELNEIFYPTDFSNKSRELFDKVLEYPFMAGHAYHLFTKLEAPFADYERGMRVALHGGVNAVAKFEEEQKRRIEESFASWSALAKEIGGRADLVRADTAGRLNDVMLEAIDRIDPDLVVMPSLTGPVDSVLVGSVAADVIRNCKRPVLVQHLD